MGFGEQESTLIGIENAAGELRRWLDPDEHRIIPEPYIRAISGRLTRIDAELQRYVRELLAIASYPLEGHEHISVLWEPSSSPEDRTMFIYKWRSRDDAPRTKARDQISVAAFADGTDAQNDRLLAAVDDLVSVLGYGAQTDTTIEKGSVFRQSKIGAALTSQEMKDRLVKVERALELANLDLKQAEVDVREGQAVANLIAALKDVPRACLRVGSILLIKYSVEDVPVIVSRQLSQLEIHTLERYPEIQRVPEKALEALTMAIENLELPSADQSAHPG